MFEKKDHIYVDVAKLDGNSYVMKARFTYKNWDFVEHNKEIFKGYGFTWEKADRLWFLIAGREEVKVISHQLKGILGDVIDFRKIVVDAEGEKKVEEKTEVKEIDTSPLDGTAYEFLKEFQRRSVITYKTWKRVLLAYDMGLGKTATSVSMIRHNKRGALIVVPKALITQWVKEIRKWFPGDSIIAIEGTTTERLKALKYGMMKKHRWLIMNYEFVRDSEMLTLPDLRNYAQIYDEMYKIKNHKSMLFKACKKLVAKTDLVIGLTGTPMENNLYEFYTILNFLRSGTISYMDMENHFVVRDWWGGIQGYRNLSEFNKRARKVMTRVRKSEVAEELPGLVLNYRFVDTESQYYEKKGNFSTMNLRESMIDAAGSLFEIYMILRMADSDITRLKKESVNYEFVEPFLQTKNKAKLKVVLDLLEEIGNNQVIIFTYFKGSVAYLIEELGKEGYDVRGVTGDSKDKEGIKDLFLAGDIDIVVTTDVWGYGLDLPDIDYMICYDLLPNPAKMAQRWNRIYRINSKRGKVITNLIGNVIEQDIYDIIEYKLSNIEQAVEGVEEKAVMRSLADKYGLPIRQEKDKVGEPLSEEEKEGLLELPFSEEETEEILEKF